MVGVMGVEAKNAGELVVAEGRRAAEVEVGIVVGLDELIQAIEAG